MCHKIEAQVVVANYFADCENTSELTVTKLKSIKADIEAQFIAIGKFLIIDISEEALNDLVYNYSNYFTFNKEKDTIYFMREHMREQMTTFYEDVFSIFNSQINHKIKYSFLTILEKILEKESEQLEIAS